MGAVAHMAESTLAFPIMRQSGALTLVYEGGGQPVNPMGAHSDDSGGRGVARPPSEASATLPCIQEFVHDIHKRHSVTIGALEEKTALDPTEVLGVMEGVAVRVEKPLVGAIINGGSNTIAACFKADRFGSTLTQQATRPHQKWQNVHPRQRCGRRRRHQWSDCPR